MPPPPAEIEEEGEPPSDDDIESERPYTVDAGGRTMRPRKRRAPSSSARGSA
jgi:hypothetical protein